MILKHPYLGFIARLHTSDEGRVYLLMRNPETGEHKITLRSRYRMEVKLGRELECHEQVDHRDEDRTNDNLTNLKLITARENSRKHVRSIQGYVQDEVDQTCVVCDNVFRWEKVKATCGASCLKRLRSENAESTVRVDVARIRRLRRKGLSSYAIAETTGYARNTVMKHWQA